MQITLKLFKMKKILLTFIFLLGCLSIYADTNPSFPGGEQALNKYLTENVKYPAIAMENGVEGVVLVGFLVTADGQIQNAKIVKFIDPDLEKEALRVVLAMPAWLPAEQNGVAVEAQAQVSVPFILPE